MASAVLDKRKARIVTSDGRLKIHSKTRHPAGFHFLFWDELTYLEQTEYLVKWPEFNPQTAVLSGSVEDEDDEPEPVSPLILPVRDELVVPVRIDRGKHARRMQMYQQRAEMLENQANQSADSGRYGRLMNDASQFRLAVAVLQEAEEVPSGLDVTFGYAPKYGMFTRLPPAVSGAESVADPIQIYAHTYRTNDPVGITWLRRLIREGADDNLVEITEAFLAEHDLEGVSPHSIDAAVAPDGMSVTWLPRRAVEAQRRSGAAKMVRTA